MHSPSFLSRLRSRALLEFDALQCQAQIATLVAGRDGTRAAGTVLLCELMANYASIKVEILLAIALRHRGYRSEEHTSELQSLMRISSAVFCLTKKKTTKHTIHKMLQ